jgi:two-component system phosphate regulon response regulator PhoB
MNGKDGLTKAQLGSPDVIILDLMMPEMSGFEVCAALKKDERYSRIPIIIFTGKGQEMDERLCRELGAEAYITKPHDAETLLEQIEVLLAKVLPQHQPPQAPAA